ncbi:hypothetical protein B484DRAFT_434677 [Ochromonadaceae sp. CCMP2298]|nr:hypothetical protein B484DRAFT_434677 [Ochromonadaceae sp. CCMP2298]|mmetsp:Transcript_25072/g.55629  ORF Transcript_25072/g.55629 Transcript_25072/m.55629 type:complete len:324 (-) Transcript_25072:482-1453(-)
MLLFPLLLPLLLLLGLASPAPGLQEGVASGPDLGELQVLLYTFGKCGSTTLVKSFETWRESEQERATWPGRPKASRYVNKMNFLTREEKHCQFSSPVMLTHNYKVAQHVIGCAVASGRDSFWVVSIGRTLEAVLAASFYEKSYFERAELRGTNTSQKADWFIDHISPQIGPYSPRSEEDAEPKRNSRRCHFFSDLASLVVPNPHPPLALGAQPSASFRYDPAKGASVLRRGAGGAVVNLLLLRFEEMPQWAEVIRRLLPGWGQFFLVGNQDPTTHYSYPLFKSIVIPRLAPEHNPGLWHCDVYGLFYADRLQSYLHQYSEKHE